MSTSERDTAGANGGLFRLDNKAAIVTGAGSGIGRAIAEKFAACGAVVYAVDIQLPAAEQTANAITAGHGRAIAFACDVGNQVEVKQVFSRVFERARVQILVNSAGISHIGTLEATSEEDFERVQRVNVKGTYHCMLAAIGQMKQGGGVIINMASIAGSAGLADRFAYSASKGAVVAMTYSVARDYLSHGVRCVCISPARVHTPFVDDYLRRNYPGREREMYDKLAKTQPIGRMGLPAEIASLALFLASDEAGFITGVDYPIDGGFFNLHG